jgi:hypothetical protein
MLGFSKRKMSRKMARIKKAKAFEGFGFLKKNYC